MNKCEIQAMQAHFSLYGTLPPESNHGQRTLSTFVGFKPVSSAILDTIEASITYGDDPRFNELPRSKLRGI